MRSLLLFLCACGVPDPLFIESVREYDGYVGYHDDHSTFLVRDALTGEPIEGAIIRQHVEAEVSDDARWAPLIAETRTDEFGLAWIPNDRSAGACHWAVHAEGYAPTEEYGTLVHEVVELERGQTLRGRLVDPFGDPIAGARVETKWGCAHAPALVEVTTGSDGVFVFHGVQDGDFPFYARGVEACYTSVRILDLPLRDEHTFPGGSIEGRVLFADGTAPGWGVIQNDCGSRGPMARLERDGSFRIEGGAPRSTFQLYLDEGYVDVESQYRPGGPFVIRVGSPKERGVQRVSVEGGGPVVFERESDGKRFASDKPLPRGRYVAILDDHKHPFAGRSAPFEVPGPERVQIERLPLRKLDLVWEEPAAPDGDVVVMLEQRSFSWEPGVDYYLPEQGRQAVRVELDGAVRHFPVQGGQAVVRMPKARRLVVRDAERASLVFLYGSSTQVDDDLDIRANSIRTRATGELLVHLEFDDVEQRLLHFAADDSLEPARIERHPLPPARRIEVAGLGDDWRVTVCTQSFEWYWPGGDTIYADEPWSPWLRDGATVRVHLDVNDWRGMVPRLVTLEGDGPYKVRFGDCSVEVRGDVAVYCDGWVDCVGEDGIIRGLDPGEHTFIFSAEGHRSQIHRVFLKPGERRVIDAQLSPR